MRRDSKRLLAIQRLIEKKERDAAARFAARRQARDRARARLEELDGYHRDYLERYRMAILQGGASARLREYRAFIDRLEQAITEQRRILAHEDEHCSQAKQAWSEQHTQVQAVGKVIERKQADEHREEGRREQRLIDDRGPRRN